MNDFGIMDRISAIFWSLVVGNPCLSKTEVLVFCCTEKVIDDAELLRRTTMKNTSDVCRALSDDFFMISAYIIGVITII